MAESMQGLHRSHRCTEVNNTMIGNTVTVMGWVQKSRNKGGIIFVDLRDRSGMLQVIFEEANCGAESFAKAQSMRILQPVISKSSRRISVSLQKQIHHHSQSRRTARRRKIFA